jgi:TolB-like protein/Tfp pilus assembly protein PilF
MHSHTEEVPAPQKVHSVTPNPFPENSDRFGERMLRTVALVAVAFALGVGFWELWHRLAPEITPATASESAYAASFPEKSIAVLPFLDLNQTEENAFLAEGVQDDILTALSKLSDLKVISRTSANAYSPKSERNLREIAQSLGVAFLVEGTVSRTGEKVQITVHLTDARKDRSVWSKSYECDMTDLPGIQTQIVPQIASQLEATVSPKERASISEGPTKDLLAYGLYVRAKDIIESASVTANISERLTHAVELLDQAVARDPQFYFAYCQLAEAHDYLYFYGLDRTSHRFELAQSALNTVIRLRPNAAETHLAKANFFYRCHLDYVKARAELAIAQHALPNNSHIFELTGYIDRRQGMWTESARSLQRAIGLDPRNSSLLQQIALSYQETHQFGSMAAALDRALNLNPRDIDARVARALLELEWRADTRPLRELIKQLLAENPSASSDFADPWLYVSLCERDQTSAAQAVRSIPPNGTATDLNFPRAWCEALVARSNGDAVAAEKAFRAARIEAEKTVNKQPGYGPAVTVLGLVDAGLGRKDEAIREGRHAMELLPVAKDAIDGVEVMKYLAVIYAWTGEKDLAIQQIEATLRIPSTLSYGNLKLHPNWDRLRGDPRFEKIVADLAPKATRK